MSSGKYPLSLREWNSGLNLASKNFTDGKVIWDGSVKAIFKRVPEGTLKIVRLEMSNDEFTEFIPRHVAQQILTPPLSNRSTSPDARRSPAERNQTLNRTKSDIGIGDERSLPLPKTTLNEMGVPTHLMRFLEVILC